MPAGIVMNGPIWSDYGNNGYALRVTRSTKGTTRLPTLALTKLWLQCGLE